MNAHRHRLVFNRARGLLMAVAETACAQGKSPANAAQQIPLRDGVATRSSAGPAPHGPTLARLRPAAFATLLALGAQLAIVPLAQAQVVAYKAAPASQRPTVLTAGNGVPLVNIQTPSAAGVSRNTYSQFDVETQGVILNNSRTNTSTQLGGWVQGNPWLARGSARVILNEVISANPSQLLGYIEVAGSPAQVVIANPAGVTCNGCGFINASRATLTTGKPVVSGGNLDGYRVEGGSIRIDGAGMDASRVGYTDLIARAVEVNAGLWAQTLKVTAGTNVVDADNSQATPITGSGAAPAFAIDVAQLGGMYAGKIVLVGTEAGVGVRNAGYLGASAGEVLVTADGRLTNSGSLIAAGNIGVDARAGVTNTGTVYAQGDLGFATAGDIENSGGLVAAGGNATLAASGAGSRISGDTDSIFAAGMASDGSLGAAGNLAMSATEHIAAHGRQLAGGDLAMSARSLGLADSTNNAQNVALTASAGDLDLSRATTVASGTLTARAAKTLIHEAARTSAEGDVILIAGKVLNHQGRIGAGGALSVESAAGIDNSDGLLFATGALSITAANLDNRNGALQAADNVTVQASGAIDNRAGLIRAGKTVALTAASTDNASTLGTDQGIEGQSASLTARDIGNAGGALRATANLTLAADRSLDNTGGLLSAGDTLAITDSSAVGRNLAIANASGSAPDSPRGTMIADKRITIDAASLAGQGEILGLQDVDVKLTGDTVHSGRLVANRNLRFETAGTLDNSGLMEAGNALTVTAGTLNNAATGTLKGKALQLTATNVNTLTNRGLINGTDTRIDTVTLNNLGTGRIYGDTVSIAATTLTNEVEGGTAPTIAARNRLDLGISTLANRDGALIFSAGDLAIGNTLDANRRATGAATNIENTSAGIESIRDLAIDASSLTNQRRTLTITREVYQEDGASSRSWTRCDNPPKCSYWTDMVETTTQYLDKVTASTPAATIRAGRHATLSVGDLTNRNSTIEAGGDLALTGNTLTNEGAELYRRTDVETKGHRWHYKNGLKDHGTFVDVSSTSALADTVPAIISAGGTLTGSYTDRIDNVAIRQATAPTAAGSGTKVPVIAVGRAGSGAGRIGRVPVGSGQSVVSANPDLSVPENSLFRSAPEHAHYVKETDPAFANHRQWLSSDYMLRQLDLDPATSQKRLGDGFYEQRLITEQIAQLTGRRFLTGYQNDEAQYQALMEAGATFAKTWQLIPGIALSAEQMARLTTDMVWLVEKEVAGQKVLVPQVYARVQDGDLASSGALLAGAAVNLETGTDLINSGRIAGRQVVSLSAENLRNLGGDVTGKEIFADARKDLQFKGGSFTAENRLIARAGRNLTVESSTVDLEYRVAGVNGSVRRTDISRVAGLYVTGDNGTLVAAAGHDLSLLAAALVNGNPTAVGPAGGTTATTVLAAGNKLTLGTVTETRDAATSTKKTRWRESAATEIGSSIQTAGDLTLTAGNDLSARAAYVATGGALDAAAGRDLRIESGEAHSASDYTRKSSSGGFLSKKRTTIHNASESTTAIASTFSGDSVTLTANRDVAVKGSNVVATKDTTLVATRDLLIEAATETHRETHFVQKKKSGLSGSLTNGVSVGKSSSTQSDKMASTTAVGSAIGGDNILLSAGRDASVSGSQVIADRNLDVLAGRDANVLAAQNTQSEEHSFKSKSSSLQLIGGAAPRQTLYGTNSAAQQSTGSGTTATASLLSANAGNLTVTAGTDAAYKNTGSGNVTTQGADLLAGKDLRLEGNAVNLLASEAGSQLDSRSKSKSLTVGAALAGTVGGQITRAYDMAKAASDGTGNSRLNGAMALKAGYDAYKAIDGAGKAVAAAADGAAANGALGNGSAFGVSISIGSSRSQSESHEQSHSERGSNLQAENIALTARETDLTAVGAKIEAARNVTLDAKRDLKLLAATNTEDIESRSKGSNVGLGVTFGFGQQSGISFQIGASQTKGKTDGHETTYDNTRVTAGETLALKSGGDTALKGAQVGGKRVEADIGGRLDIETLQDRSEYKSKQTSGGFSLSICVPPICYGTSSGSVSAAQQKIEHSYRSAVGQSGIAAGEGGFDIQVGEETRLKGAAITSTAEAAQNRLTTKSLDYEDLTNTQKTKASSYSLSLSGSVDPSKGLASAPSTSLAGQAASNLLANLGGQQGLPESGSERSQTLAVISPATITLTGTDAASQQAAATLTSRDPKTANQALTNTLTLQDAARVEQKMKNVQQNAQAASLIGQVAAGMIGDLAAAMQKPLRDAELRQTLDAKQAKGEALSNVDRYELARLDKEGMSSAQAAQTLKDPAALANAANWQEGSANKILLHGLAGVITAKVGNGSVLVGAATGAVNEAVIPAMSDYLKSQGITPEKNLEEYKGYMQLGSALLGAGMGAVADGKNGAALGATVAHNATTYNFLSHQLQNKREELRKKQKDGRISTEELTTLKALEQADQRSDELLAMWKTDPASLNDTQKQQLASYLNIYAAQEGETKFNQLLGPQAAATGAFSNYGFPYAGTPEAQEAYLKANPRSFRDYLTGTDSRYNNENRQIYDNANSQLLIRGVHQAQADFANSVLLATVRPLTVAYGAYQAGYGGKALYEGDNLTGLANLGLGTLAIYGASTVRSPVTSVANEVRVGENAAGVKGGALPPQEIVGPYSSIGAKPEIVGPYSPIATGAPTRLVNGVVVVDRKSGTVFEGTVDLGPTLDRIHAGGNYPHRNDGSIFQNRPPAPGGSPLLPVQQKGYYKEYVVPTPGVNGSGPQRIVVGKGGDMYYTPDHYGTFIPLRK